MERRLQVLHPILDPLDGAGEAHGERGHRHLFREELHLRPEGAAHVRAITRIRLAAIPRLRARPSRSRWGTWVEEKNSSVPLVRSQDATAPQPSMGMPETRGWRQVKRTRIGARSNRSRPPPSPPRTTTRCGTARCPVRARGRGARPRAMPSVRPRPPEGSRSRLRRGRPRPRRDTGWPRRPPPRSLPRSAPCPGPPDASRSPGRRSPRPMPSPPGWARRRGRAPLR